MGTDDRYFLALALVLACHSSCREGRISQTCSSASLTEGANWFLEDVPGRARVYLKIVVICQTHHNADRVIDASQNQQAC